MNTHSVTLSRHRATVVLALVLGFASASAAVAGPAGAATTGAAVAAPDATTTYDKGSMVSSTVSLSPADAPRTSRSAVTSTPASRAADGSAAPAPGTAGWTTTQDLLPGTQMIALSWDGPASTAAGAAPGAISVRSRGAEGWGTWTQITAEAQDQGGEGTGRVGSGLIWLGSEGADQVEVRVDQGPLVGLDMRKMRYEEGAARTVEASAERSSSSRSAARPTIRPRSDWASGGWASGNSGCGNAPSVAPSLKYAVVHHTASTNSYTAAQVPGILQGMYEYHTRSLRWCDMAYNFLIDKFGTIWQGRSGDVAQPVIGGHAMGFNSGSVGIALLGQFDAGSSSPASAEPTSAMMDSSARLLAWKLSLAGLDPTGQVTVTSGGSNRYPAGASVTLPLISHHQQSNTTACPGSNVVARMGALRTAVAGSMGGSNPTNPTNPPVANWQPFPTVQDLVWRQYSDFQRNPGAYDDRRWWADSLTSGSTNRNALVASLLRSGTVDARAASAMRLYLAYFGRIPDSAGIRYWWSEMDRGKSVRTVSNLFTGSPEFRKKYGSLSDTDFVRLVYRNVMGRDAEAAGVGYWVGELRAKRENRGGVMAKFTESTEYKTTKRTIIDVMLVHEAMLGRAVSPQSHLEWIARVNQDGIGAMIGAIYASPEYAARVG